MKYFIFRNNTIEIFFGQFKAEFSGYGDISQFSADADAFLWFYLLPVKADSTRVVAEIADFYHKINLLHQTLPENRPLIIFTLENLANYPWQNADFQLTAAIQNFNHKIQSLAAENPNIKIIDFGDFLHRFSAAERVDWKFYYLSQIYLNPKLAGSFKKWLERKLNALHGKRKKCLILDLDNTLWGGILGEDGIEGIQLGNTYPGSAFRDFQENLFQAAENGIILAACSKNNETDVLEAWEKNPNMILRREAFAAYRINWQNKAVNILELAQELNIGLDSLVFLDDNPVERNLVRAALPEVTVPDFPEQPYQLPGFFREVYETWFQVHQLTPEDREKTLQYQTNARRVEFQKKFGSLDEYLANLEMELDFQPADRFNIARIAQMTQKTNQFNLTTRRYSENDLQQFLAAGDQVVCLGVKDKFGDNGITAAAIVRRNSTAKTATIDSFLLSCRVLGRGIEQVFLALILNQLREESYSTVFAEFLPTRKNQQTENFYDDFGFTPEKDVNAKKYTIQLREKFPIKNYYNLKVTA